MVICRSITCGAQNARRYWERFVRGRLQMNQSATGQFLPTVQEGLSLGIHSGSFARAAERF